MRIYEKIVEVKNKSIPAALAILINGIGSIPQKPGAKMLVLFDGSTIGTIGGGCLEVEVIQEALQVIQDEKPKMLSIELNEKNGGLICGGKVEFFIDPIIPRSHLIVFGAGHIGRSLSKVANFAGFRITVIDDRKDYANRENISEADDFIISDFSDPLKDISVCRRDFIVVATRGHRNDFYAIKASLITEAGYIGLLGSKRKKTILISQLKSEGFSERDINRIITPVGIFIHSKTPEEIAISIIAQVIQHRGKEK
ncbi:MAG: XdhC family protein [Deltaproteobacteria bacterium]|nr:XdhC family protein [Deltaproteobacteria bacterium]MBW1846870.1 XdhC family protein [Deltaproteobacteria bacterium]MBW2364014.1 XdhC family protein [Deltaproteobacteria bacterium]